MRVDKILNTPWQYCLSIMMVASLILMVGWVGHAYAAQTQIHTSNAIVESIIARDKNGVTELILSGQNMDANHNAFVHNAGQTMTLDLWGAKSKLAQDHYTFPTKKISSVNVGQAKDRVRFVINMLPGLSDNHQIIASKTQLIVRLGKAPITTQQPHDIRVEDVHFQADDRIAHIIIRTNSSSPVLNIHEKAGNVLVDINDASLTAGQERSQDVRDFPGPIKQIDAYKKGHNVRIVARLRGEAEVSSFQQGNILTLTLTPKDMLTTAGSGKKSNVLQSNYSGQKVTFDFKDIDIKNALKLIAEMSNLNIIMSNDVTGTLTMRLIDVPWDQALDIILTTKGLGKEQQGNVLRIAPMAVIQKQNVAKLAAQQGIQQLEPLVTEVIELNYATATDIKTMIDSASATTGGANTGTTGSSSNSNNNAGRILSPRGSLVVDTRTNILIVKDTRTSITNVKRLIAAIDTPVRQVLIAARIVEAKDNFTRDLGVRWGGTYANNRGRNKLTAGAPGLAKTNIDTIVNGTGTLQHGFLVDLPAAIGAGLGGGIGLSFGTIAGNVLDLELSAAEADGVIKIVSNPRVMTVNNKPALISQGDQVPYVTPASANNPATVTLVDAVLSLSVTPQITADQRVLMLIDVKKDSPAAGSNPIISTKHISTSVFVNNGETIVIGGIFTRNQDNTTNSVPGLGRIPFLGWLFKKNFKRDDKTELLIFITPTIVKTEKTTIGS